MPSTSQTRLVLLSLTLLFFSSACSNVHHHHRHILHHPFFSPESPSSSPAQPPTPSLPPKSQPKPKIKHPFSATTPTTTSEGNPFFPTYPVPPPPPSRTTPTTSTNALPTFPANISSLALPRSSPSTSHTPVSTKLIVISSLLSVLVVSIFSVLAFVLIHRRRQSRRGFHPEDPSSSDDVRLYPSRIAASDGHLPKLGPNAAGASTTSSEFLYLGTLATSREFDKKADAVAVVHYEHGEPTGSSNRQKAESPEIRPLPPLPKQNFQEHRKNIRDFEVGFSNYGGVEDDEEEFYSPRGSSGRMGLSSSSPRKEFGTVIFENKSSSESTYHDSNLSSLVHSVTSSPSPLLNFTSRCLIPEQPEFVSDSPSLRTPSPDRKSSLSAHDSPARSSDSSSEASVEVRPVNGKSQTVSGKFVSPAQVPPPTPPPLPPPRFWENVTTVTGTQQAIPGPPPHVPPSGPIVFQSSASMREQAPSSSLENNNNSNNNYYNNSNNNNETLPKPKLKPLHWDKVRASSEKVTVWDRLKPSSFELNEEMIETLFVVNGSNSGSKDPGAAKLRMPLLNPETRVLDPKKSQNVAILLRALNVTVEEVCDALLEGNVDTLGTELLESLLKMAPTKEEERKLREYKDESLLKLGSAEKFLQAVLEIPFAFKRVDAMLYIANFDSEVEHLKKTFDALEAACEELRSSRMFLKLLEAVLKTGNRMNVGTNRGDAQAFKLDTLLKLADVKGADGKTTLLHFVVQEIIRSEGSRLHQTTHNKTVTTPSTLDDIDSRKRGLDIVAGLGAELGNVKKAAAMDSDVLINDVRKLAQGIIKVGEAVKLEEEDGLMKELNNNENKFLQTMNGFLKKAEVEIMKVRGQEKSAFSKVKELTEYFHGNLAKEEAHPLRFFMVVRDFLGALDQVCKEVGKINERSAYQFSHPVNPSPPLFPTLKEKQGHGSSDNDESASPS